MTAEANLIPYLNPPDSIRARAMIMSDDAGEVQIIASEGRLVNPESLARATNRELRPLPYDFGSRTAAIPGFYNVPVIVDEALTHARDLALATTEPGGYVRACGTDLTNGQFETLIADFTEQLGEDPSNPSIPSIQEDTSLVHAAIGEFTTLRIHDRLDKTLHIPPLPEVARKILELHSDPRYDLKSLTAIIETDPSMAARIMGWANSAFYHVNPPALTIDDAVMRVLGLETVMSMALGMALGQTLNLPEDEVRGLPPYWLDAVFTAATTEALARQIPASDRPSTGLCYLAGLLANFGTLVLGHVFPPHYEKICRLQELNSHLPHTYIDQHVLKLPREVLASTLLELWCVPQQAVDAVRYQYVRDYTGSNASYVYVLQLARQSLGSQGISNQPTRALQDSDTERLGLSADQLSDVLGTINDARDELDNLATAMVM